MMVILTILAWLKSRKRLAFEAILGLFLALSISYGTIVHKNNLKLQNSLEMANNNIESYLGIINGLQDKNNTLVMNIKDLENSNDSLVRSIAHNAKNNNIKLKTLTSAATQKQSLSVSGSKGVGGSVVVINDTIYTDSLEFNPQTKAYYSIGRDTVSILLDIENTQYLYTYKEREYKNKKNFIRRLLTLDFKKVNKYKYLIYNSNDLIKESDVRVIEIE